MSRKTKTTEFFGVKYRIHQFSAIRGMELLDPDKVVHPVEALELTEATDDDGNWHRLDNEDSINKYVRDVIGHFNALLVLKLLMDEVRRFSFGFIDNWTGVPIPRRFQSEARSVSSQYTQPMIGNLMSDDYATLRELEEYYSLEDAFKMFNVLMTKAVNTALAHEAAEQKAKERR